MAIQFAKRNVSVTFVIMAGGRGERLWPLVRSATPKVCLSRNGRQTLLQATIERLRPVWPTADWLIVTTREQAAAVRDGLPAPLRRSVLVEPQGKNTAACITLAAIALATRDPSRVMVVVPADHWIGQAAAFRRAVRAAVTAAVAHDTIATIGIRPTHPHSGLGYLCAGERLGGQRPRIFRLARFVEKPSRALARRLLRRGRTYWNSGTFVGTADTFLECVTEWLPDHTRRLIPFARALRPVPRHSGPGRVFAQQGGRAYRALEAVSFDHGVMDHLRGGIIVEGDFPWADLGSWDAWTRAGSASARTVTVESRNVTVVGPRDHLVAAIGVRDLVVVHTPSATLICRADKTQAVREVVKQVCANPRLVAYR